MKVKIFCVGGTIDKIYFDAKSKYEVGAPAIGQILKQMDVQLDYSVESVMAKDSLEMTDQDRAQLAEAVQQAPEKHIVITHGTDTMVATATAMQSIKDKTIVLTGALAPAIFRDSDAAFNVGGALAAAQVAPPGIYIAMNGKVFRADEVQKDVANNRFVPV